MSPVMTINFGEDGSSEYRLYQFVGTNTEQTALQYVTPYIQQATYMYYKLKIPNGPFCHSWSYTPGVVFTQEIYSTTLTLVWMIVE